MASTIKGITVEIGGNTQPLEKALKNVNKTARDLNSELRVIDKLLELDPSNTNLLAQRQQVLSDAIENTSKKLNQLKTAQQQAQAQLERGEIGADQYRALERQVISTENALNKLNQQSQQTGEAFDDMGDAAQKSGKDMDSLTVGGVALGTMLGNLASRLIEMAGNAATFLTDSVEATKEFRSDLSKLEQNAKTAGTSFNDISGELEYFVAITDETDSSVEALSNLLKAGFTGETLTDAVNNLSGAVIAFPDTLKIESLADSLQETLATGAATGQYGELLERLGVNLEEFDAGLQKCTTSAEKQQYAIDILAKNGLADLNDEYKTANADLISYSTAQTKYTETLSKVATAMQPVMTAFTQMKTSLLEGMVPALETAGQALTEKLASPEVQAAFEKMGEGLASVASAFADFAVFVIENGEIIVKIIGSIAAGFVAWKIASIIQEMGGLKAAFLTLISAIKNTGDAIKSISASTIIGAIVTIAGIVASLAESFLGASNATENFKDEMASLKETAESMATDFATTQEKLAINADTMRSLSGEIQNLDSSIKNGNLSAGELAAAQGQLTSAVAKYNAAAGEQVLKIDAATGAIEGGTDALFDNTEALIENAKRAAEVEALQQAYEAQTQAQAEQATQLAEIDKYYNELSDEQKKYIDQMKEEGISLETLSNLWWASPITGGQVNNEIRGIVEGLEDSVDAEKAAAGQVDYLSGVVEEGAKSGDKYAESVNAQSEAVKNLTAQEAFRLLQMQENGQTISEEQTAQLEAFKANNQLQYEEMEAQLQREQEYQDSRLEITTTGNEAIKLANDVSLAQRLENIQANQELWAEYEENLALLRADANQHMNESEAEAMLQYINILSDGSVEAMGIVSQLADNVANKGGETAYRYAAEMQESLALAKPGVETTFYGFGNDTVQADADGIAANDAAKTEFENTMQGVIDNVSDMVGENGPFYWLGIGIINRLVAGIRQIEWKLYNTVDSIVSTLKSKFTFEIEATATRRGGRVRGFATGGVVWNEEIVRVAENGPEAIIPLNRLAGIVNGILSGRISGGGNNDSTIYYQPKIELHAQKVTDAEALRLSRVISREFAKAQGGRMS